MFQITAERPGDAAAIEALLDRAFGPNRHTKASYQYRRGVAPVRGLSFVIRDKGELVGTIRYWPVLIGAQAVPALLLGPLAVKPERRGEGIGVTLVIETMKKAAAAGHRIALLVGELDYYERFGFHPAAPQGLAMPSEKPERLLAAELQAGALAGVAGDVLPCRQRRRRAA